MQNSDDAAKSGDWIVRDMLPEDEACLVSMWLKSYAHAREVRDAGFGGASVDGSPDEIAYWRTHQPIVMSLLAAGRVRVACPPGRAVYTEAGPAVIAGWVCTTPGLVHWVGVKRSVAKLGVGDVAREMILELLVGGDSFERATFDLLDAKKVGMLGEVKRDRAWLATFRTLSRERGASTFASVVDRIMTARRWTPSSERAA